MVAKKFVVVADVPVAFVNVKFWSVEDEVTRRLAIVAKDDERFGNVEVAVVEVAVM